MTRNNSNRQRGFTLLEVIVVLMISSLIATILVQGLSLVLNTRFRVMSALTRIETEGLQTNIIVTPLRGLLPDHQGELGFFAGNTRQLKGLTLSPLHGTMGAPTVFSMTLERKTRDDETALNYLENGYEPVELARWPGNVGEFSYVGRDGVWKNRWPVVLPTDAEKMLQVPRTIRLDTGLETRPVHVVRVMGPHNRPVRLQDTPFRTSQ